MADFALLLEAERRGILPEDKKGLLAEARKRGLVPSDSGTTAAPAPPDSGPNPGQSREPGAGEYLLDRAKRGFAGLAGSPGDVVDLARDLPTTLAVHPAMIPLGLLVDKVKRTMGGGVSRETLPTERAIATSKTYRDAFGVKDLKTENDALRYFGGVVEMGAAGGPMVAAQGIRAFPLITSTVGAGLGMEAGGDVAQGIGLSKEAGQATGALAGGIIPTLTGSAIQGGASFVKNRFSPAAQRAAAESTVARDVTPLIQGPQAQSNLQASLNVTDEFAASGRSFTPSLPARTGSPGLLSMEKDLVTRSPASLEKAVANVQKNEQEIAAFVNDKFPAGKQTSAQRIADLQRKAADKLEALRVAVDDKLDDLALIFARNPNNYEAGAKVRELVFKQKELYRGMVRQREQDMYAAADRLGVRADVSDVAQFADDVVKSEFNAYQASEIPPVFRQLAKRSGKGDLPEGAAAFVESQGGKPVGEVSFAELHSLYKRTNSDIASLRGSQSADAGFKTHLLNNLKTQLEKKLATFEGAGFGEVSTKLKEFNRFYREEYLPRFKQGFGGDVTARFGTGEFKTPNQEVVNMITKSNNAQAAKDFKLLFDDVPEAWQSLRDGYMDKLIREGNVLGANGKINQKVLDRFLRVHSQTLSEFPQIKNEFQRLALDNGALLERQSRIVAAQKELAAADLFKLFNGKDPSIVVPEAVASPNVMRLLVHRARHSPKEGSALARAIAEDVVSQRDPVAYYAKNREAITTGLQSLGKDHIKNLEIALDAMAINRRTQVPQFVQSSGVTPDPVAARFGSSPRAIISHFLNAERGRTGYIQESTAFLGRFFEKLRQDHKVVAMEAVFYDKDAARAIANLARQPASQKIRTDFVEAMASLGIRAEIAGQE